MALATVAGALTFAGSASSSLLPARPMTEQTISEIESLMATPPFDQGVWGLQVRDVATGKELFGLNAERRFQGASTTKNFTTSATLDALGKNRRFRTRVTHTGRVNRRGTVRRDLILRASGDLTMGGRETQRGGIDYTGFDHSDSNEVPGFATLTPQNPLRGLRDLARQVKRSGIERVRGDVVIDDRLWKATQVNHEVISPIIVNDNMIDVMMTPTAPGELVEAETRPATAAYEVDVEAVTVPAGEPLDVEVSDIRRKRVVVSGEVPADAAAPVIQVVRIPDPAYFARSLFIDALRRAGVKVGAKRVAPNRASRLPAWRKLRMRPRDAVRISPPISEFVKLISKVSHNPGANTAPFWIGVEAGRPSLRGGMRKIRAYARKVGLPRSQFRLIDGQGSPDNTFSPDAMTDLLTYVHRRPYGPAFLKALPIKGVDGVPENPELDPGTGHVFQKNGVNGALDAGDQIEVQAMALAGYARAGRRLVAFDLVVNHVPVVDADGNPSQAPKDLVAAFTRFGYHEAITTLIYLSQKRSA